MKTSKIIDELKTLKCDKSDCKSICVRPCMAESTIIDAAIDRLESLEKEREACFRLGQMDMQESVVDMLKKAADNTFGIARSTLRDAAKAVAELEASE